MEKLKDLLSEITIQKHGYKPTDTITEDEIIERVGNYSNYGNHFYNENNDFSKALDEIITLLDLSSQHIVESESDWFSKITLKKDAGRIKKIGEEFKRIRESLTDLKKQATVEFEDAGNLLSRYYSIKELNEEESAYQKKFKAMLKKYNVKSPKELSDEQKKEFFQKMDASYKAKKETD